MWGHVCTAFTALGPVGHADARRRVVPGNGESDQAEAEGTWVSVNYYRDTMCHSHSPRTLIVNHCALYKVSTEA